MYVPDHFRLKDGEPEALRLANENPFATLITVDGADLHVDHVPLLVETGRDDKPLLLGHFSRRNPHAAALGRAGRTLAVFHGPHAYVSPRWYAAYDVPTWNYAVAHLRGTVRLLEDDRSLTALVGRLAARFEAPLGGLAGPLIPDDLKAAGELSAAILGFELFDLEISVKLKLNQNRSPSDQRGARIGLERQGDHGSRAMADLMGRINGV